MVPIAATEAGDCSFGRAEDGKRARGVFCCECADTDARGLKDLCYSLPPKLHQHEPPERGVRQLTTILEFFSVETLDVVLLRVAEAVVLRLQRLDQDLSLPSAAAGPPRNLRQ